MKISYVEFLKMSKDLNIKVKRDRDYALKLSHENKVIATVLLPVRARFLTNNYHQLPAVMRDEVHAMTYWLDRDTVENTEQMELF